MEDIGQIQEIEPLFSATVSEQLNQIDVTSNEVLVLICNLKDNKSLSTDVIHLGVLKKLKH